MALTKEQIKEFKEAEAEADAETDNFYKLKEVADKFIKRNGIGVIRFGYSREEREKYLKRLEKRKELVD